MSIPSPWFVHARRASYSYLLDLSMDTLSYAYRCCWCMGGVCCLQCIAACASVVGGKFEGLRVGLKHVQFKLLVYHFGVCPACVGTDHTGDTCSCSHHNLCDPYRGQCQAGSLTGAVHLSKGNAGVLRLAQ